MIRVLLIAGPVVLRANYTNLVPWSLLNSGKNTRNSRKQLSQTFELILCTIGTATPPSPSIIVIVIETTFWDVFKVFYKPSACLSHTLFPKKSFIWMKRGLVGIWDPCNPTHTVSVLNLLGVWRGYVEPLSCRGGCKKFVLMMYPCISRI